MKTAFLLYIFLYQPVYDDVTPFIPRALAKFSTAEDCTKSASEIIDIIQKMLKNKRQHFAYICVETPQ